ncbi:MAG: PPC domain-containing protein [Deltaproteobacteria bacterium]|nr:PPC domain-containing protein [Deltaproteobacteria bacterium]
MKRLATILATAALAIPVAACVTDEQEIDDGETVKSEDGKTDASALAVFLDMEFQGTLLTDSSWNDKATIEDQLLYTVGHLNGTDAVGRIDRAVLSGITKTTVGGKTQIKYTVKLPVAWRKSIPVPATYEFKLPKDISSAGQTAFATKYSHDCVDFGAHDVDAGSMFYYYRPDASRCNVAAADVTTVSATVRPSPIQTTGKFPEYNKIWEDNVLNVVAIFGKYEDGATTSSDAGIAAYNTFIGSMKSELSARSLVTVPATVPSNPGVGTPDIEFKATLPDGKKINVVAMLTDNVRTGLSQSAFRARYEALSTRADYIVYNGHAGLGVNVRALAQAGKWVAGQYVVVYMNGCDTFAYIDDALNTAHKAVNPDDTTGYKYVDIVNNALPAFFASMSGATMSLFRGFLSYEDPKTYEQMFSRIDSSQLVLVVGEQDNTFTPGGGGTAQPWSGLNETGSVKKGDVKKYSTPTLAAGTYTFTMTGTGGDADLYVKIGREPTATSYDCRPYKTGSNETCQVTLAQSASVFVQVRGYATAASSFKLVGKKN